MAGLTTYTVTAAKQQIRTPPRPDVRYTRPISFLAVMCAFAITYQAGAMSDVSEAEAELFMSEFEKLVEGIDALGIFTHNTIIALPMFLPGAGLAWGFLSSWSTGFAFAAISTSMPELVEISPLSILFLSPFGLMEICAYSLAMSRSLLMVVTLVRRGSGSSSSTPFLSAHLRPALLEAGVVVALLLAGGYVEFFLLEQAQELFPADAPLPGT